MADEKSEGFGDMVHSFGRYVKVGVVRLGKVHKSVFKAIFPKLFKDKAITAKQERRWKEEFDGFDRNKDGFIALTEMQSVFKTTGHDHKRCEAMFESADKDGDGQLNFEEYKSWKLKVANR